MSASCAASAGDGPPPQARNADSVQAQLQALVRRHGVCNAAVAVIRQRRVQSVEVAQGCTSETPLAPDGVFEAASLSKPVFAYAVLKLVQQGRMALDAPVSSYLPNGYAHRFHPYLPDSAVDVVDAQRLQAVTVRMALNHTSGLPNWAGGPLVFEQPPGAQWQYSGEGYALLQQAVEAVTHEGLDAFMAQQVFKPLGMRHSAYTLRAGLQAQLVPGTTREGAPLQPWPFSVPVAAFTLYTSAQDYGAFVAALLNDDRTLAQIAEAPVPVSQALDLAWGQGWGLERQGEDVFLWQWGNNPGYRAFAMASPRSGDGFVLLTNGDHGLALAEPLGRAILGGPHPVFRFPLLRDGLAQLLCEHVDVCP